MPWRHVYFDGCNGDVMGESVDDDVVVDWILKWDEDCGNGWTREMAEKDVAEGDIIILDFDGDMQCRLIPS